MKKAIEFLKKDKVMGKIIDEKGKVKLSKDSDYFQKLVINVMYQQLNGKAARAIYNRFLDLFPERTPTPKLLSKVSEEDLLKAGVSRQKRGYLYSIAEKFIDGTVTYDNFPKMPDEEIINELVQIKGIGRWSAQMFLMFSLGRKDVFAPDDFGLRKAIQVNYGFEEMPKPKEAEKFAERWKPYRSYASLYLWKSID